MARTTQTEQKENPFLKEALKLGLLQLLGEVNTLLNGELSAVQRLANLEMKTQLEGYLKDAGYEAPKEENQ